MAVVVSEGPEEEEEGGEEDVLVGAEDAETVTVATVAAGVAAVDVAVAAMREGKEKKGMLVVLGAPHTPTQAKPKPNPSQPKPIKTTRDRGGRGEILRFCGGWAGERKEGGLKRRGGGFYSPLPPIACCVVRPAGTPSAQYASKTPSALDACAEA